MMRILIHIFLFIFLLLGPLVHGQEDSSKVNQKLSHLFYQDVKHTASAIVYTFKRPIQWKKKQWATFGAVVGASFASALLDHEANNYFINNQSRFLDPFADAGDFIGQPEHQGPFLLTFWAVGLSLKNQWMRETSSMIAATMATSGMLTAFGKEAFGRARPNKEEGNASFKLFAGKEYHSLPSAHTSISISSAWILARQIRPLALKIPFYAVPVVVAWSRVYDNAHWVSDVVVSSALSIACAEAVIRYYSTNKNQGKRNQKGLSFLPNNNGLSIIYRL